MSSAMLSLLSMEDWLGAAAKTMRRWSWRRRRSFSAAITAAAAAAPISSSSRNVWTTSCSTLRVETGDGDRSEKEERKAKLQRLQLPRSEEHTSELQSRENLVCRLLLEKKNDYHA